MPHAYTEDQPVEQPAIGLFAELDWQTLAAMKEVFGASGTLGRKSGSVIADYLFVLPPQQLVVQFEKRVAEIRSLLTTLLKQTVNLRQTRDLLLPRLLSGQIERSKLL